MKTTVGRSSRLLATAGTPNDPALQRLLAKGLVTAEWGTSDNNRRARFYRLTPAGRRRLGVEEAGFREHFDAIRRVLRSRA